ncbi:hypothetical protein Zmor_022294 [Zophobas morio]|uniref:Uncharacterized protein n=1 Tax=Zophobas morio TaxID=2755281 RepID=A0AA38M5T6_9CUCU|nr:hypothetical protein Zmor_022294 [Zophobas morio]
MNLNKMEESGSSYTPRVCRLCLAPTATTFSLVESNEISGMLEALTSLRILPSDEISTVMCLKCHLNLKLAFAIRQKMVTAEQRFQRRVLQSIKTETNENNIKQTEKVFTCDICGKQKHSKKQLRVHKYSNHEQVECSLCKKQIRKGYIREHIKMHERKTQGDGQIPVFQEFACDICGTWKSSEAALRKHKNYCHVERDCPVCLKKIKLANYNRHLFQVHGIKVERLEPERALKPPTKKEYTCYICGGKKASKTSLYNHTFTAHRSSECPVCKMKIKTANLTLHIERHKIDLNETSDLKFKCNFCDKELLSKPALTRHVHTSHSRSECPICKKNLSSSNLNHHIRRHARATTVCEVCGLTVKTIDIKYHMMCHSSVVYKCDFCDKEFKRKNNKVLHERREHKGEANFVCETCGKRFYSAPYLKRHISAIHLKLKPFACNNCDLSFSTRNSLRTHSRQHTDERPYKCDYCGEGFKQKVSLKSHLRSQHDVHEELTCECDTCGKKFASKWALLTHSRVHS